MIRLLQGLTGWRVKAIKAGAVFLAGLAAYLALAWYVHSEVKAARIEERKSAEAQMLRARLEYEQKFRQMEQDAQDAAKAITDRIPEIKSQLKDLQDAIDKTASNRPCLSNRVVGLLNQQTDPGSAGKPSDAKATGQSLDAASASAARPEPQEPYLTEGEVAGYIAKLRATAFELKTIALGWQSWYCSFASDSRCLNIKPD